MVDAPRDGYGADPRTRSVSPDQDVAPLATAGVWSARGLSGRGPGSGVRVGVGFVRFVYFAVRFMDDLGISVCAWATGALCETPLRLGRWRW